MMATSRSTRYNKQYVQSHEQITARQEALNRKAVAVLKNAMKDIEAIRDDLNLLGGVYAWFEFKLDDVIDVVSEEIAKL